MVFKCLVQSTVKPTARRWCEKSPRNIHHVEAILKEYKNRVRFIHMIRDGRDVVTSRHPKKPDNYWVTVDRWVNDVEAGLKFKDNPQVYTVKYETLLSDFESTMKDLLQYLELNWEPQLSDYHFHTTIKTAKGWDHAAKPLNERSIGKWQAPEFQKVIQEFNNYPGATALLKELGYN